MDSRNITIILTQACNLSCSYCYEHFKTPQKITFQKAKEIIDFEFLNQNKYSGIEFELFGGEPFLEFNLLKQIAEYIESKPWNIPYIIFSTTNGTLIHGEIQRWLESHRDSFVCGLSLDGNRKMHNINRSNSYDLIDLDFFRRLYPNQDVKMTISPATLPDLAEGVIDIHLKGFDVSCNFAFGIDWSDSENRITLERELHKLISFYLEHPDINPCSLLSTKISVLAVKNTKPRRLCGTGNEMVAYDIDGKTYPCQFFLPMSIGEEKAKYVKEIKIPKDYIPIDQMDKECLECLIEPACANCLGANYANSGRLFSRSKDMCILTKISIKACSFFYAERILRGQLKLEPEEMYKTLRAILNIQKELKDI